MISNEIFVIVLAVGIFWVHQRYIKPRLDPRQRLIASLVATALMVPLFTIGSNWEESGWLWILMGIALFYGNLTHYRAYRLWVNTSDSPIPHGQVCWMVTISWACRIRNVRCLGRSSTAGELISACDDVR